MKSDLRPSSNRLSPNPFRRIRAHESTHSGVRSAGPLLDPRHLRRRSPAQAGTTAGPSGTAATSLPNFAGTLPGAADMTTAFGTSYLYVLTQWGFARAPLGSGTNPTPYSQIVIGNEGGSGSGGAIVIKCDCHAGSNTMDVAEGPGGDARMIARLGPVRAGGGGSRRGPLLGACGPGCQDQRWQPGFRTANQPPERGRAERSNRGDLHRLLVQVFRLFSGAGRRRVHGRRHQPVGQRGPLQSAPVVARHRLAVGPDLRFGRSPARQARLRFRLRQVPAGRCDLRRTTSSTSPKSIPTTGSLTEVASVAATSPQKVEIAIIDGAIFIFAAEASSGIAVFKYDGPTHALTRRDDPERPHHREHQEGQCERSGSFPGDVALPRHGRGRNLRRSLRHQVGLAGEHAAAGLLRAAPRQPGRLLPRSGLRDLRRRLRSHGQCLSRG